MPPEAKTPQWLPYMGMALALAGMIYQGGALANKVENNSARIAIVEAKQAKFDDLLGTMNVRGASNETKLDFLVERAARKGQ